MADIGVRPGIKFRTPPCPESCHSQMYLTHISLPLHAYMLPTDQWLHSHSDYGPRIGSVRNQCSSVVRNNSKILVTLSQCHCVIRCMCMWMFHAHIGPRDCCMQQYPHLRRCRLGSNITCCIVDSELTFKTSPIFSYIIRNNVHLHRWFQYIHVCAGLYLTPCIT